MQKQVEGLTVLTRSWIPRILLLLGGRRRALTCGQSRTRVSRELALGGEPSLLRWATGAWSRHVGDLRLACRRRPGTQAGRRPFHEPTSRVRLVASGMWAFVAAMSDCSDPLTPAHGRTFAPVDFE